jgi:hypothetical protein
MINKQGDIRRELLGGRKLWQVQPGVSMTNVNPRTTRKKSLRGRQVSLP